MKKSLDITIILDKSGSMNSLKHATIRGFNEFIDSQKNLKVQTTVTLVQFNHEYFLNYEAIDIETVKDLNKETYVPYGLTALLDAIGKTIKLIKKRQKLTSKDRIPNVTMIVIITDGYENNSKFYTQKMIFKEINKMEKKRGWEFIYLGANQDAILVANNYGIMEEKALTVAADENGIESMFNALAVNTKMVLIKEKKLIFTKDQRDKQKRETS